MLREEVTCLKQQLELHLFLTPNPVFWLPYSPVDQHHVQGGRTFKSARLRRDPQPGAYLHSEQAPSPVHQPSLLDPLFSQPKQFTLLNL